MVDVVERVEALVVALDLYADVGGHIEEAQLAIASPCAGWSVRDVIAHSVGVIHKFAAFARGETDEPRTPTGDLLGGDHRLAMCLAAAEGAAAWSHADLSRHCRLPFGTFAADVAAGINLFDVLAHTWDLASAVGMTLGGSDELWRAGLEAALLVVGPHRDAAHYGEALPARPDDPPRTQLLAFLGRVEAAPPPPGT